MTYWRTIGSIALSGVLLATPAPAASLQTRIATLSSIDGFAADRPALDRFYAARNYTPVWLSAAGAFHPHTPQVLAVLGEAGHEGLRPADYAYRALTERIGNGRATWETELLFTASVLRYIGDAQDGRQLPRGAAPERHTYPRNADTPALLARALATPAPDAFLRALHPPSPGYRALRAALANYRAREAAEILEPIAPRPTLRPGDSGLRVAALRSRLVDVGFAADVHTDDSTTAVFDAALEDAVRRFQKRHGLAVDGAAGMKTINALNRPAAAYVRTLLVNMERWRWLPDDLGVRHVRVDIAGFEVTAYENGVQKLAMRAIVGKPYRQTPAFSSVITDLIFQPYWYVPERIAVEDLLPKLQDDPTYLQAEGYSVFARNPGGWLIPVVGEAVNWAGVATQPFPFVLRQEPGPRNSLGLVRFGITNPWDIYLHGTSAPQLFNVDSRALSSGCVRLEDPLALATFVLAEETGYDERRVAALYNRAPAPGQKQLPQRVILETPVPVHVGYWTAHLGADGEIEFRPDLYERDAALAKFLGI